MNKFLATMSMFLIWGCSACGGNMYIIGDTEVWIQEGAEPWPDFPEVLLHMQEDKLNSDIPNALWKTRVHFRPVGSPHPEMKNIPAACFFAPSNGEIYIRATHGSTFQGCFAHELAHRWVALEELDDDCPSADSHKCPAFQELKELLNARVCKYSWSYEDRKENPCPKIEKEVKGE